MIKASYSMLTNILSVVPHFRFDGEMISNCQEAMMILRNTGYEQMDSRERELLDCINIMCVNIKDGVEIENDTLIAMSTPSVEVGNDIQAKCMSASESTIEMVRNYINTLVLERDVIESLETIHKALEGVRTAPNMRVTENLQNLTDNVKKILFRIDQKAVKKTGKTVEFSRKKIKGIDQIFHQLRHEEKNVLSCGVAAIDELTGKFKPSKLYTTIALTGGFKSGYLENCTLGIAKNNPNMERINGLENAVLHITFENDLLQIFKRFIDYHMDERFFSKRNLNKMTDEEIMTLASEKLSPQTDKEMEIILSQFSRYSVRPDDLISIVANHKRCGKRVVAIVLDYADLLKPPIMLPDEYDDSSKMPLVRKFEELKLVAQQLKIPIITAGQFNRTGEFEAKRSLQSSKYPTPLMGSLNGSHIAGGYALKFHVESLLIQYRGPYMGHNLLHLMLDKDRDGEGGEADSSNTINGNPVRFIKFYPNGFRISPKPEDAYKDIRDVVPPDDGGIISAAFKSAQLKETVDNLDDLEDSKRRLLDDL